MKVSKKGEISALANFITVNVMEQKAQRAISDSDFATFLLSHKKILLNTKDNINKESNPDCMKNSPGKDGGTPP